MKAGGLRSCVVYTGVIAIVYVISSCSQLPHDVVCFLHSESDEEVPLSWQRSSGSMRDQLRKGGYDRDESDNDDLDLIPPSKQTRSSTASSICSCSADSCLISWFLISLLPYIPSNWLVTVVIPYILSYHGAFVVIFIALIGVMIFRDNTYPVMSSTRIRIIWIILGSLNSITRIDQAVAGLYRFLYAVPTTSSLTPSAYQDLRVV